MSTTADSHPDGTNAEQGFVPSQNPATTESLKDLAAASASKPNVDNETVVIYDEGQETISAKRGELLKQAADQFDDVARAAQKFVEIARKAWSSNRRVSELSDQAEHIHKGFVRLADSLRTETTPILPLYEVHRAAALQEIVNRIYGELARDNAPEDLLDSMEKHSKAITKGSTQLNGIKNELKKVPYKGVTGGDDERR